MGSHQKEEHSRILGFIFWVFIVWASGFLIYQMMIKPVKERENKLEESLPPLTFTLFRLSDLCQTLSKGGLSLSQQNFLLAEIKNTGQELTEAHRKFEVATTIAAHFLDSELLKLEPLSLKFMKQALDSRMGSCPLDLLSRDKLEALQTTLLNRYPHTWFGILLFQLGIYKLNTLDVTSYLENSEDVHEK